MLILPPRARLPSSAAYPMSSHQHVYCPSSSLVPSDDDAPAYKTYDSAEPVTVVQNSDSYQVRPVPHCISQTRREAEGAGR